MILYVRDNNGVLFLVNVKAPLSGVHIDGLSIVFAEPGKFIPLSVGAILAGESTLFSGTLDREALINGVAIPVGTPISLGLLELDVGSEAVAVTTISSILVGDCLMACYGSVKFDSELKTYNMTSDVVSYRGCRLVPSIESSMGVSV